ncbi:hypothetical protein H5410_031392 [Solanum commersonii]|uniref:Uncharacterized protein n=1 Tax=Solanum commersonii TaxID=4109 RepID=A0A9J5YM69_SOLCO|nr:hypothetical protein H5410_031392 [Solanum commersonii]
MFNSKEVPSYNCVSSQRGAIYANSVDLSSNHSMTLDGVICKACCIDVVLETLILDYNRFWLARGENSKMILHNRGKATDNCNKKRVNRYRVKETSYFYFDDSIENGTSSIIDFTDVCVLVRLTVARDISLLRASRLVCDCDGPKFCGVRLSEPMVAKATSERGSEFGLA